MKVGAFISKLVPATMAAIGIAAMTEGEALQVTPKRIPAAAVNVTKILLFAVTAVVFMRQMPPPPPALVAHENAPAGAALQEATEGLAAVPTPAQFVVVTYSGEVALVFAASVVNVPAAGVPPPMAPGAANVAPPKDDAFKLATLVVEAITSGAVPVARVEVN